LVWEGGAVPNYEYLSSSPFVPSDQGFILGGTCFAVRSSRLRDVLFDTVIFDEAGQVTLPLAVAGMLAGLRYIFIGDHKQMAPVVVAEHKPTWVARSVFENLFEVAPGTMLTTTYRMNAEINDYPSKRFYGGRLQPSSEARGRRLHLDGRAGPYGPLLDPSSSAVFVDVDHSGKGMRAPEEAEVAAGIVDEALNRGLDPSEIAVVAPYRAQVRLIREQLRARHVSQGESGIIVDTVERIQGQERDVIVISLTTSDPSHAAQRADFYFQPNRLNVAITRPRVKRIVLGSRSLFDARPASVEHRRWVEHFRGLYESSRVFRLRRT
jgi:DNA replication ATP-dependent helicase Dna2